MFVKRTSAFRCKKRTSQLHIQTTEDYRRDIGGFLIQYHKKKNAGHNLVYNLQTVFNENDVQISKLVLLGGPLRFIQQNGVKLELHKHKNPQPTSLYESFRRRSRAFSCSHWRFQAQYWMFIQQ